jgi:anti-sigma factor RsiW
VRTSCEQARERLSLQLDDELSGHESLLLERHLGRCGACAAFAADVRTYTDVLREAPLEPAPQFLLLRRPAATRGMARVAAVTAAAAAAVLVAVSTVSLPGNAGHGAVALPSGLAVQGTLGVQQLAASGPRRVVTTETGPRRGVVST